MRKINGLGWESVKAITWNFTGMGFSLVNGILTARILAPDDRGVLALAITLSTFSFLFSSLGTNVAVRTFQPKESWASLQNYLTLTGKLMIVDLVIISTLILIYAWLEVITINSSVIWIVLLSAVTFLSNQLLDTLNTVGLVSLSARVNTLGHCITMLSLIPVFIIGIGNPLSLALIAYLLGYITRAISITIIIKIHRISLGESSTDGQKNFVREGIKFWGVNIGQTVTFRADQLLLGALSGAHQVGIYAVAVTPTALMQVVSNTLGQTMFRQAATGRLTVKMAVQTISIALGITFSYGILMWIFAPLLIPLIFGNDYATSASIIRVLLIGELFLSPYLIIVRILSGFNHPLVASWSGLIGLLVLVPMMLILVPARGAIGAAISAVSCYAAMAAWVSFFLIKVFRRKIQALHE